MVTPVSLPRAIETFGVVALSLFTITLLSSCRGGRGGGTVGDPVAVDSTCNVAQTSIDLPEGAGVGLVIQVKRDSQCPVKVTGLSQFQGEIAPGNVVMRPQNSNDPRTVKLDCGENRELKCKYSYLKLGPRQSGTLAKEDVATTCNKGDTSISLGGGNFTIDVQVLDTSQCPVEVSGINAAAESLAPGSTKSYTKLVQAADRPAEIKLSCGTATDKNCKYNYSLKSN